MQRARTRRRKALIGLAAALLFPRLAAAAPPYEVTACGVSIKNRDAYLTRDLRCLGPFTHPYVVEFRSGGTLDLRGFSIQVADDPESAVIEDVVRCSAARCAVRGPGTIQGARTQISMPRNNGRVIVDGGVLLVGGETAVRAPTVQMTDGVVVDHTGDGIVAKKATLTGTFVGDAIVVGDAPTVGLRATKTVRLVESTVQGNRNGGVVAGLLRAESSSVTDDARDPECGVSRVCADIALARPPKLVPPFACGKSLDTVACADCVPGDPLTAANDPATHDFGVCTND